jgi:predicted TIM-barrel fold metal-dependent hydrolase
VTHKLLFGTDYPFTHAQDSIQGLKNVNAITANSGLPRISDEVIEGILSRDALMLLGVAL